MCGCLDAIAKLLLFLLNFVVFLCGAALLGVGIALIVDDEAIGWITEITGGGDMNDDLFKVAVYVMISVGGLLFIVGFFGCCGACKENVCMLQTYAVLVCILLLAEIAGGILAAVFISEVDEGVRDKMTISVQEKYGVQDTTTEAWDAMQIDLKCCGAVDYNDYDNSTYYMNSTNIVPPSCCVGAELVDKHVKLDNSTFVACKTAVYEGTTDSSIVHIEGCYVTFKDWVEENAKIIMGVFFGLGAVQLIAVILACCLKSSWDKK